jgi:predicted MPP superfamily phosphohydrolase
MELYPKKLSRRHFLLLAPVAGLAYMRFGEPRWLDVGRHEVPLSGDGRRPLTLLQLSDFHASHFVGLEMIAASVELGLRSCTPDVICLTGDYITWKWEDWDGYAKVLAALAKVAPTFACMGNHDGGRWAASSRGYDDHRLVAAMLAQADVQLLHNRSTQFFANGWRLNLVGVGDEWAKEMEPALAFRGIAPADLTILLSHNPDTKTELREFPWDLLLCGHTHGGQLDLPVIGTPFAPIRDKRYVAGLHRWEERWLHVTKGVGNLHGMRLHCRPEVSVLTLR